MTAFTPPPSRRPGERIGRQRGTLLWTPAMRAAVRQAFRSGGIAAVCRAFPGWPESALRNAVYRYGTVDGEPAPLLARAEIRRRLAAIPGEALMERLATLLATRAGPAS